MNQLNDLALRLYPYLAPYFLSLKSGYEEGAFTPTYVGGTTPGTTTYSFQVGIWRRLGNVVIAIGQVAWSAATGTGEARISLPFSAATSGNVSGGVWMSGVTFANSTPLALVPGTNYFVLDSPLTNAGNTRVQVEAGGNIVWTITYIT